MSFKNRVFDQFEIFPDEFGIINLPPNDRNKLISNQTLLPLTLIIGAGHVILSKTIFFSSFISI